MKVLNAILNWFNGKKTAIGAIFTLVTAYGIAKGFIGEAEQDLFLGISTLLIGGGLAHKAKKAMNK